jgi:hypothetical protein
MKKDIVTVYGWAVAEFLEAYGFYPNECEAEPGFVSRSGEVNFPFEIVGTETDASLTAEVKEIIYDYFPVEVIGEAVRDWELLLERFAILDGTEDSGKIESENEDEEEMTGDFQSSQKIAA